ncbi:uncharacterized protein LOC113652114 isoform X2 [Tachysurus fulvidraco]|uniref:uncharacterized protein LOC113652114 isoform X2 n=1 Tax=Tachysurus fulvidraco TaxID=1234273 RepID=UPI001FF04A6D|nr:uncharacterized protein LOC113652114 isoform X2 [Tachysurus fulvidraco]
MRFSHFSQLFVCISHPMGILLCLGMIHDPNRSWKCLNDYLYTIKCELNMTSETLPHDALYWLEFRDEREPFECVLMLHTSPWVCVMNLSTRITEPFMDMDIFQISLNYSFHGKNDSVVLATDYRPVYYIQPVPPSHLMLLWKQDEAVFHWLSGYDDNVMLVPYLRYQLSIQGNGKVLDIHSSLNNLSVPMSAFAPNTNYTAHVRSEPHQIDYKGVWSHWGPTVSWTTGSTSNPNRSWKCLNDYLYTIRCKLNMTSETLPHDALYWLEFYDAREPFECVLMLHTSPWVCVMNLSTRITEPFMDLDSFQISLNYSFHGKNDSVVLATDYRPVYYIQPVPPSHLMLLWKQDEAVFHWLSGYDDNIMLVPYLRYQLSIQGNGKVLDIHSSLNNLSVPMSAFAPNTNYTALVRSEPHQIDYKGVWSHWGPTVSWTTGSTSNPIRSWKCLNDYLYTIRCELNMTSETLPHDALYWLEFRDEREPFECVLMLHTSPWVCVMNLSTRITEPFMDLDSFQISLIYSFHGKNDSVLLATDYRPVYYIQPVPPSHLMLLWKQDEAVFHWLSGYDDKIMLVPYLRYQLSIQGNGKVLDIHSSLNNLSVPMSAFAPNTNYTALVRSEPNQIDYKGVWSHWGPTVSWTTGSTSNDPLTSLAPVLMTLFALPIVLLFYFSYTKCKESLLTSSPAPHIGDFKCSVMLPTNVGDLLQREESLQIDTLIEEPNPTWLEKMKEADDGSSQTSSTITPTSPCMGSWAQAWTSVEQGSVMYSDEYCTLSHTPSEHGGNDNVTHAH